MRKFFTLMLVASALIAQAKVYTLAELADLVTLSTATETVGVALVDGNYVLTLPTALEEGVTAVTFDDGNILLSKSQLELADGNGLVVNADETLLFGPKACIRFNGTMQATDANFGAAEGAETTAVGFRLYGEQSNASFSGCIFTYVGIAFGNGTDNGALTVDNCTFTLQNTKSGNAAINFTSAGRGNVVQNSVFFNNNLSDIASGANTPVGITIKNNTFTHEAASNRLYPAINMTLGGDRDVVIEGNTVKGPAQVTRGGGIAVSNLLGGLFTGTVYVRNNDVQDCSYGITLTGQGNIVIENNTVKNNKYIASAMNGGSGINITFNSTSADSPASKAFIKGNLIEGNLWGVTVIGKVDINAGKVDDPNAEDYNPGENIFKDNGNDGVLYDFYNNTAATSYAQGNSWNVDVQDAESIEQVIYHKVDDASLGEVIFMPAQQLVALDGKVTDSDTGEGIEGVNVTLTVAVDAPAGMRRADGEAVYTATTDANGEYSIMYAPVDGAKYVFTFEKEGYETAVIEKTDPEEVLEVALDKVIVGINDINSDAVVNVKYVNIMGQVSDKPFKGINIVGGRKVLVK